MRATRPIPGTVTAFSILTSVACLLAAGLIGGLWALSTVFQRLINPA
jgi:hypothetical protein